MAENSNSVNYYSYPGDFSRQKKIKSSDTSSRIRVDACVYELNRGIRAANKICIFFLFSVSRFLTASRRRIFNEIFDVFSASLEPRILLDFILLSLYAPTPVVFTHREISKSILL